ncbi:MAG: hypothetical protein GY809_10420, partial [Planctomycetes bacterium]|nr:hypothetical protein [Planctomycetota bacterium]
MYRKCLLVCCVWLLGLAGIPSAFAGITTEGLIQDLNADAGVTVSGTDVTAWANQAPSGGDDVATNQGTPQLIEGPSGRAAVALSDGARLAGADGEAFDAIMQGSGHTWFAVVKPDTQNNNNKNAIFGTLLGSGPWSGIVAHVAGTDSPGMARYMVRANSDVWA